MGLGKSMVLSMRRILLILPVVCLACETVVEVEPPPYAPQYVATGFFSQDSTWSLTVHRSLSVGEFQGAQRQFVDDATVSILLGDKTVDKLRYHGSGWYRSTQGEYPIANTSYTLSIEVQGHPRLMAVAEAPAPAAVLHSSVELLSTQQFGGIIHGKYKMELRFKDTLGPNYYGIRVYRLQPNPIFDYYPDANGPDSVYQVESIQDVNVGWYCGFVDAAIRSRDTDGANFGCTHSVVMDEYFDGREYVWSGVVSGHIFLDKPRRNEVLVVLSTLSEEYFEYHRTLDLQGFDDLFSEPLSVFSNIQGGLGIFAGYANTYVPLLLGE